MAYDYKCFRQELTQTIYYMKEVTLEIVYKYGGKFWNAIEISLYLEMSILSALGQAVPAS